MQLLIVGASARAAAQSAARCDLTVATVDLFADADLPSAASAQRVDVADYPDGLAELTGGITADHWMYTGGLENHPDLVDHLSERFPLAGVAAAALRQVRDPLQLAATFARRAIAHPAVVRGSYRPATDRPWLLKPLRSTGGQGIRPMGTRSLSAPCVHSETPAGGDTDHSPSVRDRYWQEQITGLPAAGIFLADGRQSRLYGVTRQWTMADMPVNLRPPGFHPYQYVGSIGPLQLDHETKKQWADIGQAVAHDFGLRGLFGVDAIMQSCGTGGRMTVLPIEVNPRYTASVEVLERALNWRAISDHVATGFHGQFPCSISVPASSNGPFASKLILFARRDLVVRRQWLHRVAEANSAVGDRHWPVVADIPHPETRIRCGQPVCTLLTSGASVGEMSESWGLATGNGQAQRWLEEL